MASMLRSTPTQWDRNDDVDSDAVDDAAAGDISAPVNRRRGTGATGGFGRKLPLGRIDHIVNTPNKKSKGKSGKSSTAKKMDASASGKKKKLFVGRSGGSINRKLSKSLSAAVLVDGNSDNNLSYDFASITSSETSHQKSKVTSELYSDDADKKPSALSARKGSGRFTASTARSIFRASSRRSSDTSAQSFPAIFPANPVYDIDRHYTISFGASEDSEESTEEKTGYLHNSNRMKLNEAGEYVLHPDAHPDAAAEATATAAPPPSLPTTSSIDSIFRNVDQTLESVLDSFPCLQLANPIQENEIGSTDDNDGMYQLPESLWKGSGSNTTEDESGAELFAESKLKADEVDGYTMEMNSLSEKKSPSTGVDSIFRSVDDTVESVVDSMLCLQRASAVVDSDDEDEHQNSEVYFAPDSEWDNKESAVEVALFHNSRLQENEVEGFILLVQ